ncbi:MAG: c-type cytochrome [Acidobacteriota bacterium]|nr:c-type cytochrome [Acidobacteriota bacterium]
MKLRRFAAIAFVCVALPAPLLMAQRGGRGGAPASARPVEITASRAFDTAQVDRGGKIFAGQCASCHGANARGGKNTKTDADLLRSDYVLMDHGGREFSDWLKTGRPEKGMPKFELPNQDSVDLAMWLHHEVTVAVERQSYVKLNIFSGDAKAGEAFFNGSVGKCAACHSVTGDLKGIGEKNNHDAPTLQASILNGGRLFGGRGRGGRGARGGGGGGGNVTATVTTKEGKQFTGTPLKNTDFVVEIRTTDGEDKTWLRDGQWPKVKLTNRLQAHMDLMLKYTDPDIHNLAAYLNDK